MPQSQALADTRKGQLTTALLILAIVLLPLGLLLPALQTREIFWRSEHTIIGFGLALYAEGDYLLAGLLLGFSVAFPTLKLGWMLRLHFGHLEKLSRMRLRVLEALGKWSLADVLVIAVIVMSLKDSWAFGARPLPGVFLFAASTMLAMFASGRISAQLEERLLERERRAAR